MPFMVATCRELDKVVRSKLVKKMVGQLDEPSSALIAINISAAYSSFMVIRLTGATFATVCCAVTIDFFLHSRSTYKLIKEHNKVDEENSENENMVDCIKTTNLILAELIEGFTPMIYGICIACAYYGPNQGLFTSIGNSYWGEPIKDIALLYKTMLFLFGIDTLAATVNAIILWKVMNINMLQEFYGVLSKYWFFIFIKLSFANAGYFAINDINFGLDSSGKFEWITPAGRLNLICNSTNLRT